MRQMDDNLIVGIATIQAIVLSLFFTAASWLKLHGQGMGHQVSLFFSIRSAYGNLLDNFKSQYIDMYINKAELSKVGIFFALNFPP